MTRIPKDRDRDNDPCGSIGEARAALAEIHDNAEGRDLDVAEQAEWTRITDYLEAAEAREADLRRRYFAGELGVESGSDPGPPSARRQPTTRGDGLRDAGHPHLALAAALLRRRAR
jgi:hypothetical protein